MAIVYTVTLIAHVLAVMVAVGSATLVDYLHLVSFRRKNLERGLVKIYPLVSRMINTALVLIYVSGILLVLQRPELLASSVFRLKIFLVLTVTINGIYLQRVVTPQLDRCVLKGTKYCLEHVLTSSAVSGSLSIVTWYSLVVLSLSKHLGYSWQTFLGGYFVVLLVVMGIAYTIEKKARRWREG